MTKPPIVCVFERGLRKIRDLSELYDHGHEINYINKSEQPGVFVGFYKCMHCSSIFAYRTFSRQKWRDLYIFRGTRFEKYNKITCSEIIIKDIIE